MTPDGQAMVADIQKAMPKFFYVQYDEEVESSIISYKALKEGAIGEVLSSLNPFSGSRRRLNTTTTASRSRAVELTPEMAKILKEMEALAASD